MKNSTLNRIIIIVFIIFTLMYVFSTLFCISNASSEMLNTFREIDNKGDNTNSSAMVYSVVGTILITLQVVAVGVALIVLVILAIKYLVASPGDKAEIKKNMIVYTVGALTVFASASILKLIQQFVSQFNE